MSAARELRGCCRIIPSLTSLVHKHHAQSVFYKRSSRSNSTTTSPASGDTTLSDLTRAGIHMSAAFNAGKCLVPLAISNKTHDMCGEARHPLALTIDLWYGRFTFHESLWARSLRAPYTWWST